MSTGAWLPGDFVKDETRAFRWMAWAVPVLIAHGFLAFADGIFWDDWTIIPHLWRRSWDQIIQPCIEMGRPLDGLFLWAHSYFSNPTWINHLLVFVLIVTIARLVSAILMRTHVLSPFECQAAGVLAVVIPAFQTWELLCTSNYILYLACFLGGALLLMREPSISRRTWWISTSCAALLFTVSFFYSAVLVLFYVFWAGWILHRRRRGSKPWAEIAFFLLPLLFFMARRVGFSPSGEYAGYNQIVLDGEKIEFWSTVFLTDGIRAVFRNIARAMREMQVIAWSLVAWIYLCMFNLMRGRDGIRASKGARGRWILIALSAMAVVASIVPFVLVGKGPHHTFTWDTRHALLLNISLALLIVAVSTFLPKRLQAFALAIVISGSALTTTRNHISIQARWVKDRAVIETLRSLPDAPKFSTFWVKNEFTPAFGFWNGIGLTSYAEYEWSARLAELWGEQSWVALSWGYRTCGAACVAVDKSGRYRRETWDPRGREADLWIRNGAVHRTETELVTDYLQKKWFGSEEGFRTWLRSLVQLTIIPTVRPVNSW